MTQRSIQTGRAPAVIVSAGTDVRVEGWGEERVFASTEHRWGLKIERGSAPALGHIRARAKVGDHVLFDVSTDLLERQQQDVPDDAIRVQAGGDAVVRVPFDSSVTVYAGRNAEAEGLRGSVTVYAGRDCRLRGVRALAHVSAGGTMDVDCETLAGESARFSAGRDLRFYIRDLRDARIMVDDLGGYWEGIIGNGRCQVRLQAGGDVVLVTDQLVVGAAPDEALGQIEPPPHEGDAGA
jgi:hypothetical protein